MSFDPYIHFQGNCRAAMQAYQAIFGGELQMMYRVDNAAQYSSVMASLGDNQMPEAGLKFVDVTICNPTLSLVRDGTVKVNGRDEYDFDDPRNATGTPVKRSGSSSMAGATPQRPSSTPLARR